MPIILVQMSDADSFLAQLVENLHRKDLSDEEKGRAFKHALEKFPEKFPNQEALAKSLGKKDRAWISHHIDVPEMVDDLKEQGVHVVPGQLTERQVRELKQLKPEERKRILEESDELPSSREIEEEADKPRKAAPPAATGRPRDPPKPTGQFFHCKECGAALTVIHKSKTRHLLKSVREVER
jgi:ParB-like chromosome segregation protein Spo0J